MTIKIFDKMAQGSPEWYAARCGILTASAMKHAVSRKTDRKTKEVTYETPDGDKDLAYLYELTAQRLSRYVEPTYIGDDMLRGHEDEIYAKALYKKNFAPGHDVGFITNDRWGFTLGYSPDMLVGEEGQLECKSRIQKYQLETILSEGVPDDFVIQIQTGLLVTERKWCDFISYCGGWQTQPVRVLPDPVVQAAILDAAAAFEDRSLKMMVKFKEIVTRPGNRFVETERIIDEGEIII